MHPTKTKIVYCKDGKRKGKYPNVKFDFLGFCFRPRLVQNFRDKTLFGSFNPAVSPSAMKAMREAIRGLKLWHQTQLTLQDIARELNPVLTENPSASYIACKSSMTIVLNWHGG